MRFDIKFPLLLAIALLGAMALIACAPEAAGPVAMMASVPAAYVHQEYPKWVGNVIVHNEAEEIAQLEKLNPGETSNEGVGEDSQDGYSTLTLPPTAISTVTVEADPPAPAPARQQGKRR